MYPLKCNPQLQERCDALNAQLRAARRQGVKSSIRRANYMFYIKMSILLVIALVVIPILITFVFVAPIVTSTNSFSFTDAVLACSGFCILIATGIITGHKLFSFIKRNVDEIFELEYELKAQSDDPEIRDGARMMLERG